MMRMLLLIQETYGFIQYQDGLILDSLLVIVAIAVTLVLVFLGILGILVIQVYQDLAAIQA